MTIRIHRFDFGALNDFRGPIVEKAIKEEIAVSTPPPPPMYCEADLEAARMAAKKSGYSEGYQAGALEARQAADQKAANANEIIAQAGTLLADLSARYGAMLRNDTRYLSDLTILIARKIAGEALQERNTEVIHAMVERCLPLILQKPRLVVETHPNVFETVLERIETTLRNGNFEGEVQFKSNHELGESDIRLDWGSGQIARSEQVLWQEVETLLERVPLELTFTETTTHPTPMTGDNHD